MQDTNDNQSPPRSPEAITYARVHLASLISLGFALIALLFLGWRTWRLDHVTRIFEDFDTELPLLTRWLMQLPPAVYVGACLLTGVLLIGKEWAMRDKSLSLLMNVTAAGIALVFWVLLQMAILLPLEKLITDVS